MPERRLEHGTPEGYAHGCRRDQDCPAFQVHGMSCAIAHIRFETGERRYMTLYAAGHTSTHIARQLGFHPATALDVLETIRVETADRKRARPTQKEHTMPIPTPPKTPLTVEPLSIEAELAQQDTTPTDPAQPLAERSHDPEPQEDAADPAIEEEAPTATSEPAAEDEEMGHHAPPKATLTTAKWTAGLTQRAATAKVREIREWARANGYPGIRAKGSIPTEALAAYDQFTTLTAETERAPVTLPVEVDRFDIPMSDQEWIEAQDELAADMPATPADFAEQLEQTRARITEDETPTPAVIVEIPEGPRPEWGSVPEGLGELRQSRDHARDWAARLEQELAVAHDAVEFVLRKWAADAELADAANQASVQRVGIALRAAVEADVRADAYKALAASADRLLRAVTNELGIPTYRDPIHAAREIKRLLSDQDAALGAAFHTAATSRPWYHRIFGRS